ncbi:MAG: LacI family DNA-binding transcriptional regulator [Sphaerochaeta sp.]|nr:LacI family DNA-binding transcriptional regulator [Sphaerochaeta sp.]HBO36633.1 hypothetical protein [Sphaerochaeta sp.]
MKALSEGKEMVKLTDIAKKAEVSPSTVSRVLNGNTVVSEEKRRAVQYWVAKLGYKPNNVAQSLAGRRSFLLGLVMTDVSNPFFSEIAKSVLHHAYLQGYSVVLCNTDTNQDIERQQVSSLLQRQIDGVIIVPTSPDAPALKSLLSNHIPSVVITQKHDQFDSVSVDHFLGGEQVASHLISSANTHLAYIGSPLDEKFLGFKHRALQMGIAENCIKCIDFTYTHFNRERIDEQMKEIFQSSVIEGVQGIFALNDLVAIAAVNAAVEIGLRVPEDISIVGFDNTYLSMMHRPSISSVAQPIEEFGSRTIEILTRKIMALGDKTVEMVRLQSRIIVRRSSSREG